MEIEATSSLLDYNKNSQRATASRSLRVKSASTNGSSFNASSEMIFQLPSNVKNTFLDGETLYLRFPVTPVAEITFEGSCGAYGLINRIQILADGQTISTIESYAELMSMMFDLESSVQAKDNRLSLMCGTGSDRFDGRTVGAGATYTFCLPLHCTMFQTAMHYIPLFSRSNIQIRVLLNSANKAAINGTAAGVVADTNIVINAPELVYYQVEVNDDAMKLINANCGGVYKLNCKDYRHIQYSVLATETSMNHTLGFSMSSLESLFIAIIPTAVSTAATGFDKASNSARNAGPTSIQLSLNGEYIPSRAIVGNAFGEVVAELCIRERVLGTLQYSSGINNDAQGGFTLDDSDGDADDTTGTYMMVIDLESMRPKDDQDMYAGISTIGSVLQSKIDATFAANADATMHYFAQNTINLELDMNASQVWVVSV